VTLNQTGSITTTDLPAKLAAPIAGESSSDSQSNLTSLFEDLPSIDELERRYLLHVLDATKNRTRAAEILGVNRKTLYRMAARLGIKL